MDASRTRRLRAFTLVELMVVITIILIVTVAVAPAVMSLAGPRKVSEAARLVQGAVIGARDAAIHHRDLRGIRLYPDPSVCDPPLGSASQGTVRLAYNRYVPIEQAPDYHEGRVAIHDDWPYPGTTVTPYGYLLLFEALKTPGGILNAPTSWAWNVRIGERIRLGVTGRWYTILGPAVIAPGSATYNPEGWVNYGAPGTVPPPAPDGTTPEFLILSNGVDDDGNGFTDELWDGIDNNLDNVVDNAIEAEPEQWFTLPASQGNGFTYTIERRPVPSPGGRETFLPAGTVIDATTWNSSRERSRLPVDPDTLAVDLLVDSAGHVVPSTWLPSVINKAGLAAIGATYVHLWITDREDVIEPVAQAGVVYRLPMPPGRLPSMTDGTPGYPAAGDTAWAKTVLRGNRRLVTLFVRSGGITTGPIEDFDGSDTSAPFYQAQLGAN